MYTCALCMCTSYLLNEVPGFRSEVRGHVESGMQDLVNGPLPVFSTEGRLEWVREGERGERIQSLAMTDTHS